MIQYFSSNNHPSNPQQPIHSLRLAPVRIRRSFKILTRYHGKMMLIHAYSFFCLGLRHQNTNDITKSQTTWWPLSSPMNIAPSCSQSFPYKIPWSDHILIPMIYTHDRTVIWLFETTNQGMSMDRQGSLDLGIIGYIHITCWWCFLFAMAEKQRWFAPVLNSWCLTINN
jgi:hypothetical protein